MKKSFDELDANDLYLVRQCKKIGLISGVKNIAAKRSLTEETVKKVLNIYVNKGKLAANELKGMIKSEDGEENEAYDDKLMEVAFWFFQHQKYVVKEGATYAKYERALKKCTAFPGLDRFFEGETARKKITETTKWKEINKLWGEEWRTYEVEEEEEISEESKVDKGKMGGGFVTDEMEDSMMDVVGQIWSKKNAKLLGCCTFVKIGKSTGILTGIDVVSNINQWKDCIAKFETEDEGELEIIPDSCDDVISNKQLATSFVYCKYQDMVPWEVPMATEKSKALKVGATVSGYWFDGDDKMSLQRTIKQVTPSSQFNGEKLENSSGCPIYLQSSLIGIYSGTQSGKYNSSINIEDISKWITSSSPTTRENVYEEGKLVKAQWSDDFWYDAKIDHATEIGYKVHFFQFGEDRLDCTSDRIKRHPDEPLPISKPEENPTFNEAKFKKLCQWLETNKLERYIDIFKNKNIDSIEYILALDDDGARSEAFKKIGLKSGAVLKIEKALRVSSPYGMYQSPDPNATIKEINNKAMPTSFKLGRDHLNFTEYYTEKNPKKTCSIRFATEIILKDPKNPVLPSSVSKGKDFEFYLLSTNHGKYFQVEIKWNK